MTFDDAPLELRDDEDSALPVIDAGGEYRVLGHIPPPFRNVSARPFGAVPKIPEDEWVEFDLRKTPGFTATIPVLDQNGKGACNGHAAASSLMIARFLSGQTFVKLSPWYVYAKLCNGIDAGSNIGDALKLLQSEGTCRFESVPYGTINPRRIPDQAEQEAKSYRIEVGNPLTTFAELMSATQLFRPFNFSIRVGGGFNNLDADGCPPVAVGPGNHAVCGGLGAKRMRNGKMAFLALNSWTDGWGDGGYFWVHEGHFAHQSWFEAYDIQAGFDVSGDPMNPPIAI